MIYQDILQFFDEQCTLFLLEFHIIRFLYHIWVQNLWMYVKNISVLNLKILCYVLMIFLNISFFRLNQVLLKPE